MIADNVGTTAEDSDETPVIETTRVCSNPEWTPPTGPFEMTELDEYVWRKDGAYGFDVGEFGSRERQNNLF